MSATTVSTPAFPILADGGTHSLGIDATGNVINYDATLGLKVHAFAFISTVGGTLVTSASEGFDTITRTTTGVVAFNTASNPMPTVYRLGLSCKGATANGYFINEHDVSLHTTTDFTIKIRNDVSVNKDADLIMVTVWVEA